MLDHSKRRAIGESMRKDIKVSVLLGVVLGIGIAEKIRSERLKETEKASARHLAMLHLMNQWVKVKQEGKNLSLYFEKNGYKKMGYRNHERQAG